MPTKTYEVTTNHPTKPKVVVTIEAESLNKAAAEWGSRHLPTGMSTFIKMVGGKRGYDIHDLDGYWVGRRS